MTLNIDDTLKTVADINYNPIAQVNGWKEYDLDAKVKQTNLTCTIKHFLDQGYGKWAYYNHNYMVVLEYNTVLPNLAKNTKISKKYPEFVEWLGNNPQVLYQYAS